MTLEQACPPEYQGAQYAFKDSMTHGFCNSHYLSHFAAFFIDARTKRSVVESFYLFVLYLDDTLKVFGYFRSKIQTNSTVIARVFWLGAVGGQRARGGQPSGGPKEDGPAEAT
jgi:hypothetical protein